MKTKAGVESGAGMYINRITGRWYPSDYRTWPEWSWQGMMLLAIAIILGVVIFGVIIGSLTGCGGGTDNHPVPGVSGTDNGRWVNYTSTSDQQFFAIMELKLDQAKGTLLLPQVRLDGSPAREFTFAEQSCMQGTNPRSWRIHGMQSAPATLINQIKDCKHCPYTDPTPFIFCPENADGFKYCNAYLHDGEIYIPDAYLDFVGPWELDNKIMEVCHVDIGPR